MAAVYFFKATEYQLVFCHFFTAHHLLAGASLECGLMGRQGSEGCVWNVNTLKCLGPVTSFFRLSGCVSVYAMPGSDLMTPISVITINHGRVVGVGGC